MDFVPDGKRKVDGGIEPAAQRDGSEQVEHTWSVAEVEPTMQVVAAGVDFGSSKVIPAHEE